MLGVAREGLEPSLFYDVKPVENGFTAQGWYLAPELPDTFELDLYEREGERPARVSTHIVRIAEAGEQTWHSVTELEIRDGV